MTAAQEKASEQQQRQARRQWIPDGRKIYDDILPTLAFKTVKSWADTRVGDNRKTSVYHLAAYIRWRRARGLSVNPDQWVEDCVAGTNRTLIEHLRQLKEWVEGPALDGDTRATRSKYYTDVRGFYAHHLVPLPRSKLRAKKEETKVTMETTASDFLKMVQRVLATQVRVRDRSIILSMLQGGMDASTLAKSFNFLAYPQFVRHFRSEDWTQWDEGAVPVKVDLVRPKTDYQFFTFVDRDAVVALKEWLNVRRSLHGSIRIKRQASPHVLATSDPIYVSDFGTPLRSHYVTNLFEFYGVRSGVNVVPEERVPRYKGAWRRYPFRSHECRDTLVTLGRRARVDSAGVNFFVGHGIDVYGYDKSPWDDPDFFREEYGRLAPYLNVISQKETMMKEKVERGLTDRIKNLEEENKEIKQVLDMVMRNPSLAQQMRTHFTQAPSPP